MLVHYRHRSVVRAKPGAEPGIHKLLTNYQTGFGYFRPTNGWYAIQLFWVDLVNVHS